MLENMNKSESSWTDLLSKARAAASDRNFADAIYLTEICIEKFHNDPDAKGWAFYNLFSFMLEYRNVESAASISLEIMRLNSNLASKLYVLSVCLDHYIRNQDHNRALKLVEAAGEAISKWKLGPASIDDFPIVLATEVIQQCHALGIDHPAFRFLELHTSGRVVASLPAEEYPRIEPFFFNKIPSNVARYTKLEEADGKLDILEVKEVSLFRCGTYIVAFDQQDNVIKLSYDAMPEMFLDAARRAKSEAKSEIRIEGSTLSILDEFNHGINFCHWMVDYVPRVLLAVENDLQFQTIVGPSPLQHEFQRRSLRDNLKLRNYLSLEQGIIYRFEKLIFANSFASNLRHPLYHGNPNLLKMIRNLFNTSSIEPSNSPIYVPRKSSRRVLNDDALWALLKTRGFRRIDTDNMLLDEQVSAFRGASHVVAPHGAALTSLMFCNPGTEVLELFPKFGGSAAFYVISAAAHLRYSCYIDIASDEESSADTGKSFINESPMMVDIDFVSSWLKKTGLD